MSNYVFKRIVQLAVLVWLTSTLTFSLLYLTGDPTAAVVGEGVTLEDIEVLRRQFGFDRPILLQYLDFMKQVFFEGSFGKSTQSGVNALDLVFSRLPATIELALSATLFAILFGIPTGILSAKHAGRWVGAGLTGVTTLSLAIPQFWLSLFLMLVFGFHLKWFPLSGHGEWLHLILPTLAVGISTMAFLSRLTKSLMLEQLSQDYIRTARAKGQTETMVYCIQALRNAALPIVSLIGLNLGALLGGAAIVESIFAWPGVGMLVIQAIENRDFPVVQAAVFVMALFFGCINFLTDLIYLWIDPRIRYV